MNTSSFNDLVLQTLRQLGGRASAHDIAAHVATLLDGDTYREVTAKGFETQVRSALRQSDGDSGLPQAPAIDGEYVQSELLTSDELRRLAVASHRRGREAFARAQAWADEHRDRFGVVIDPATGDDLDEQQRSAS